MTEEAKPIFPFGIPDISGLYQSNKEAPLWLVENKSSNELICLCPSKERANQLVKLLKETEEVGLIPTNAVSVFTWQLLLLSIIRKLTETLIEDHQFQQSEEPLFISNK
jgi:hypothetical protein